MIEKNLTETAYKKAQRDVVIIFFPLVECFFVNLPFYLSCVLIKIYIYIKNLKLFYSGNTIIEKQVGGFVALFKPIESGPLRSGPLILTVSCLSRRLKTSIKWP